MKLDNNSRFTVFKDAYSYLEKNKFYDPVLDSTISKRKDFELAYSGDIDFKKYFRGNFAKIDQVSKYYGELNLFLKNIYWDKVYLNLETTISKVYTKISDKIKENKTLFVVNMSPLEMTIIGKTFEELGAKNIVYNFNRQPVINSASKTFEAFLYIVAYKNSSFFRDKNKELIKKLGLTKFSKNIEKSFILFDENNSISDYNCHHIDDYLKGQIGFSSPKNVYRLDKYPEKEFLIKKEIKQIYFFDSDDDLGEIGKYYIDSLKKEKLDLSFKTNKYDLKQLKEIGYFEDYLMEQNKDYLIYKQKISDKTKQTYSGLSSYIDAKKAPRNLSVAKESSKAKRARNERLKLVPLLLVYPVLIGTFFYSDLGVGTSSSSGSSSGTWTFISGGSFGGSSTSSSVSSSSKSSSSIIKSFGGGGFSKGSSSS